MATIISKTLYGYYVAYDGTDVMAVRVGNNEAHTIPLDDDTMAQRRNWQNWLNQNDYLSPVGVVSIIDGPFVIRDDPVLIASDVI